MKKGFGCQGVRRFDFRKGPVQDWLQAKGGTALDVIFHHRPREEAFFFGVVGAWHAKEVAEVQSKQIRALWQVGGAPEYSVFHILTHRSRNRNRFPFPFRFSMSTSLLNAPGEIEIEMEMENGKSKIEIEIDWEEKRQVVLDLDDATPSFDGFLL